MANGGLHPLPEAEPDATGNFLTFVVPALKGCNLRCSFCLVRQRREITETRLQPEDFARFVREAAERAPIYAIGIQGYEPLLPESLPYTQAILATGRFLGLRTTFVTNGVKLGDAVDLLKTPPPRFTTGSVVLPAHGRRQLRASSGQSRPWPHGPGWWCRPFCCLPGGIIWTRCPFAFARLGSTGGS